MINRRLLPIPAALRSTGGHSDNAIALFPGYTLMRTESWPGGSKYVVVGVPNAVHAVHF